MFKVSRSNSVSSEEAPSSPESISDSSPQPSPGPHTDSVFEEDQPQYSPAYRPDSNGSASFSPSHYDYHSESSSPEPGNFDDEDDPFGCQEDFVKAVRRGDSRNLKRILSRYSQLIQINRLTTDGQTALTQSCLDGNLEVAKVLVAHGANVDLTNRDGFSPLHVACFIGRMDLLNFLMNASNSRR